jgi:hypothetical protein
MKPLPCAGAVLCSLLCLINALNGQPVLAVFCAVIAAWWVYLATASFASPNFKKAGSDKEAAQEEGASERLFLGIDGTMGDAQDVDHHCVESVGGPYCVVCGLSRIYRRHK